MERRTRSSIVRLVAAGLGTALREARIRKGETQRTLGSHLGVSIQTIHNWESGRFVPDDRNLTALSNELGVSVQDLCDRAYAAVVPAANPLQAVPVVARLDSTTLVPLAGASPWVSESPFVIEIGADRWNSHSLERGDHVGIDPQAQLEAGKLFLVRWEDRFDLAPLRQDGARIVFSSTAGDILPGSENLEVLGRVTWHMRRM